jgi:hypothetical protein
LIVDIMEIRRDLEGMLSSLSATSEVLPMPPTRVARPAQGVARQSSRPTPAGNQPRQSASVASVSAPVATVHQPIRTTRVHLTADTDMTDEHRRMVMAIREAALSVPGMDPAFLMAVASRESTFEWNARNGRHQGMFQFNEATWLVAVHRYGARHGRADLADAITLSAGGPRVSNPALRARIVAMRNDVAFAARMTAEMLMGEKETLEAALGRSIRPVDLYMTHYMGTNGAITYLRSVQRSGRNGGLYESVRRDLETRRSRYAGVIARVLSPTGDVSMMSASAR